MIPQTRAPAFAAAFYRVVAALGFECGRHLDRA